MRHFWFSNELAEKQDSAGIAPTYAIINGVKTRYNVSDKAGARSVPTYAQQFSGIQDLGEGEPCAAIYGRASGMQEHNEARQRLENGLSPELKEQLAQARAREQLKRDEANTMLKAGQVPPEVAAKIARMREAAIQRLQQGATAPQVAHPL